MSDFEPGDIWVVKVGSSLLTNNGTGVDRSLVQGWVDQIAKLRARSIRVVLVSSGAVAEGMQRLGIKTRPHSLHELQAAAAVGQMVQEDDVVALVETDKVTVDIKAEVTGVITQQFGDV